MRPSRAVAALVAVGLFLSGCGISFEPQFAFESDLHILPTPAWRWPNPWMAYNMVYAPSSDGSGVWFAQRESRTVDWSTYFYKFETRTMRESDSPAKDPATRWKIVATSSIVGRTAGASPVCRTAEQEGVRVQKDSYCIEPEGKNVAGAMSSPSGEYWFVLSADGEHRVSGPSLWGPGAGVTLEAYGQHYLQVLSVATQTFVGAPIRVGSETARGGLYLHWLDDEHIVVAPVRTTWIAVLHLDDFRQADGANAAKNKP